MKAVAVALLVLALPQARMQVRPQPAAQQFIGTWRLVSIGTVRPNGEVVTEWTGLNPSGILVYDHTGHLSVQLMHDPRTIWQAGLAADPPAEADAASIEQKAAAFSGYYAYYGRYEVNQQQHVIKHHVTGNVQSFDHFVTTHRTIIAILGVSVGEPMVANPFFAMSV